MAKTNAKAEFVDYFEGMDVTCAEVQYYMVTFDLVTRERSSKTSTHRLPYGHTEEQKQQFLDSLDFEYDQGYGSQELFGTVWLSDGTWATRQEYDGSEWWETYVRPPVPDFLFAPETAIFESEET